jgi:hypothetical protein
MKNFGRLKETITNIIAERHQNGGIKNDANVKKFFKLVKENKIIRTQYKCYSNIEKHITESAAIDIITLNGNIDLLRSISSKVEEANKKLMSTFNLTEDDMVSESKIGDAITNLVFLEENLVNLDTLTESKKTILESFNKTIKEPKSDLPKVDQTKLMEVAMNKFKEKYGENLTENQMLMVKATISEKKHYKVEVLERLVKKSIIEINEGLKTDDISVKEKLLAVKERLLEMAYNEDTYIEDLNKVVDLIEGFKK